MGIKKIYIDIGHGESGDPGAVNGNLIEHQMNIVTGNALAERLIAHGYDVKVEVGNLDINASAKAANAWKADFIISQHYNAGGGNRGEVIFSWENGADKLANACAIGLKNVGQSQVNVIKCKPNSKRNAEYFGILRVSTMPGVILEPCFIDNANDRTLADSVEEQKKIGIYVADAIASVYGSNLKEEEKLTPVKVIMNGQVLEAFLINGKTFVEIRKPLEMVGKTVNWDGKTNTVVIK